MSKRWKLWVFRRFLIGSLKIVVSFREEISTLKTFLDTDLKQRSIRGLPIDIEMEK